MKKKLFNLVLFCLTLCVVLISCTSQKSTLDVTSEEKAVFQSNDKEAVEISDDETEYEIIIKDIIPNRFWKIEMQLWWSHGTKGYCCHKGGIPIFTKCKSITIPVLIMVMKSTTNCTITSFTFKENTINV